MPVTLNPPRRMNRNERAPGRKLWTRKECKRLVADGLLTGRYELIEGEVISKIGQGRPHVIAVILVREWLSRLFGGQHVQDQGPMDVDEPDNPINEPEPDIIVTAQPAIAYVETNPGPDDILLAVEISNTTLRFDLRTKAALYARAGVRDYWVMDIVGRCIVVHREPTPRGYRSITSYASEETLSPLARPEESVRVADLLPPEGRQA